MDMNILKTSFARLDQEKKPAQATESDTDSIAKDIAIIGLDAKIGEAGSPDEFWNMLKEGCDFIRDFPQARWEDANQLYRLKTGEDMAEQSGQGAFLEQIDRFDAGFFHIAGTEADIMDPAQRLFLESAWSAIEDAGYDSVQMDGSNTGVYVGFNNMGEQYSEAVVSDSDNYGIKISGNISSIIAARISYCMNLTGPAIVVDTACSSSLAALHMACQQLRQGEIDMALVGSVKIMLVPRQPSKSKIGIESSSERTKTFDDTADGTGGGEGVITVMLKPIVRALEDHDHIYAVIKGSSLNQDGASVGITAPNAAAQEKVIMAAWKDAKVQPESISYMEAHGTATNLGDPVEITGIERAFRHYTDKKQFCAIASVKSNVGHLDCAAGMAGLLKTMLMLQNKQIPPMVHFKQPNKKIDFIDSPVYINDTLIEWEKGETPRRCGISSFGLSGTNAHVILEEAPEMAKSTSTDGPKLLVLSARSQKALEAMLDSYKKFIMEHHDCVLDDFCYTANTGRTQFNCRLAMIVTKKEDILECNMGQADGKTVFYGSYHLADDKEGEGYLSSRQKKNLTANVTALLEEAGKEAWNEEVLRKLAEQYVQGADVNWNLFYKRDRYYKISIPTYPFEPMRHWLTIKEQDEHGMNSKFGFKKLHPLIDRCLVKNDAVIIYETRMSMDTHWELGEHRVNGKGVLPGTAYIEMVYYVSGKYFKKDRFEMHDMIYLAPLSCGEGETRLVHMIINVLEDGLDIEFHSMVEGDEDENWTCNSRVKVTRYKKEEETFYDIPDIISRCKEVEQKADKKVTIVNIDGFHWSNNLLHGYANEEEIVLDLYLHETLWEEAKAYNMLPSLLDSAISSGHHFSRSVYIPYCMFQARFYEPLPIHFYSYIRKRENKGDNEEIASFDVVLCDKDGRVIAEVDNYIIMKIHQPEFYLVTQKLASNMFFDTEWIKEALPEPSSRKVLTANERVIVLFDQEETQLAMVEQLRSYYKNQLVLVEAVATGKKESMDSSRRIIGDYVLEPIQEQYDEAVSKIKADRIRYVICLNGYSKETITQFEQLQAETDRKLKPSFLMVKALVSNNVKYQMKYIILSLYGMQVTGKEPVICAVNHALYGLGMGIHDEYSNITGKCIDCDEAVSFDSIMEELESNENMYAVAYRGKEKYHEKLRTLSYQEEIFEQKLPLKDDYVYVIGGGMGGMGLSFANYLLGQNPHIKVVLLNRSYEEADLELENVTNEGAKHKAEKLLKIRKEDKAVHVIKTDISDYKELNKVMEKIRTEYGTIGGIINTAGIASDGFIMNKEWEKFDRVLKPKMQGTFALYQATKEDPLDFFVMSSSLATVYGAPGQMDYVAANAYLDSFSYELRKKGINALTIDWSGWSESGMAVDSGISEEGSFLHFVNDAEGAVILSYSMKLNIPRVLAGGIKYQEFAAEKKRFEEKVILPDNINEKIESYSETSQYDINWNNIIVSGKSIEKLNDVERNVILVWARVLGVTEIDVYDKFFEVGGNSLLASALQKKIDEKYPNILSIMDIFTYSTIENISAYISSKLDGDQPLATIQEIAAAEEQDEEDIEALVDQFLDGGLNMEDIENLLK